MPRTAAGTQSCLQLRLLCAAAAALLLPAAQVTASSGECKNGYNLGAIFFSEHSIADSELDSFATDVKAAIAKVLKGKVSIRANCVPASNYGQSVHVRLWTTAPPSSDHFVYDMAASYVKAAVEGGNLKVSGLAASQIHWDPDGVTETSTATTTATTLPTTTKTPCQGFNVGAIVFDDYNRDTYLSGAQEVEFSKRVFDKAKIYLLTAEPKVETGIKCSFVTYGAFDSKDGKGMRVNLVIDAADEVSQAEQQEFSNVRRVLIEKISKGSFFVLKVDEDEPTRANAYDGDVVDYISTTATTTPSSTQSTTATTSGTSAYDPKFISVPAGDDVVFLGVSDGVNCRPQTNGLNYLLGTCEKEHGTLGCDVMEGAAADGGDLQLIVDPGGAASCQQSADAISDLIRELTGPLNSLDLKMKCTSFKYLQMEASNDDGEAAVDALAAAVAAYFAGEIHGCEITSATSTATTTISSTATSSETSTASTSLTSTAISSATSSATTTASTTATTSASSSASSTASTTHTRTEMSTVTTTASSTATSTASNTGSTTVSSTATTTVSSTAQSTLTSTATSSASSTATTTLSTTATKTGSSTVTTTPTSTPSSTVTTTTTFTTTTTSTATISTTTISTTTISSTTVSSTTSTTTTATSSTTTTVTTLTTTTTPTTTPMFGYCMGEEDPPTCFIEFKESACRGALSVHVREICPAMCDSCITTTATSTVTSTATSTPTTSTTSTTSITSTTSTTTTTWTSATTTTTTTTSITSTRSTTTTHTATTDTTTTTLTRTTTTTTTTRTVDPCVGTVGLGAIAFTVYDRDSLGDSDESAFAKSVLVEANWQLSKAGYTTRITCTEISYGSIIVNLGANPNSGTTTNHVQAALMLEGMVAAGTFEVPLVGSRTETAKPELWSRLNSDLVDDLYVLLPPGGITTTLPTQPAGAAAGSEESSEEEELLEPLPTGWIIVGAMLLCVAILGFFIAGLVYKRKQQSSAGMVKPNADGSVAVYSQGSMQRPVTAQKDEHPDYRKGIITTGGQQRTVTPFPRPLSFNNGNSNNNNYRSRPGTPSAMSNRALPLVPATTTQSALPPGVSHFGAPSPPGVSHFGAPSPPMSPFGAPSPAMLPIGSSPQSPMGIDGGMDFFQESSYNVAGDNASAAGNNFDVSHMSIAGLSNYAIATETAGRASPLPQRLPRHAEESNLDHSMSNMQTMLGQLMRDEDVDSAYMDMDGDMEESADPGNHFYPSGPGSLLPMTML